MKKLLKSVITALLLSMTAPAAAYADESLPVQALSAADDLIATADIMKRGNMDGSRELKASFEKLNADSMALMDLALDGTVNLTRSSQPCRQEDLYILAHVICGEAQSCPDEEQLYVGSVVLNRVHHPSFPDTIKGVVFQPGQYSCTRDGNYNREPTDRNWANAKYLLENGSILPGNVVWQSGGRQGKGVYIRTGYHCYCY